MTQVLTHDKRGVDEVVQGYISCCHELINAILPPTILVCTEVDGQTVESLTIANTWMKRKASEVINMYKRTTVVKSYACLTISNSIITEHSFHWIVVLQVDGVGFVVGVLCPCCYIRQHLFILFFVEEKSGKGYQIPVFQEASNQHNFGM